MPIQLTDIAVKKIKEKLQNRQKGLGIKVSVKKTGCSGYAYTIDFVDEAVPKSEAIEKPYDEFSVWIDNQVIPYLEGSTMDWVVNGLNQSFEFINPHEKDRCGCGMSFRV